METLRKPSKTPNQKVESALEQFREANATFGRLMIEGFAADSNQARRAIEDSEAFGAQLVQARRELIAEALTMPLQVGEF